MTSTDVFVYNSNNHIVIKEAKFKYNEDIHTLVTLSALPVKLTIAKYLYKAEGEFFASICRNAFLEDTRIYSKYGTIVVCAPTNTYVFNNSHAVTHKDSTLYITVDEAQCYTEPLAEKPSETMIMMFHFTTIVIAAYIALYSTILFNYLKNVK